MKTENTKYPIQSLVSMTDFVSLVPDLELIKRYADFLKQPLKIEMIIPVNGDEKVLFKDFRINDKEQLEIVSSSLQLGEINCLTNGKVTIPFFSKHSLSVDFLTIVEAVYTNGLSDIGHENDVKIELTDTALKQIFGHAGY